MDREQLEKLLNSEEAKEILAEKYVSKSDFDAVNNKKEQLLTEKKKVQSKYAELEEKSKTQEQLFEQIGQLGYDPQEVLAQTLATLENPASSTDDGKIKKELEGRMQVQRQTYEAKLASQAQEYERKIKERDDNLQYLTRGWNTEKIENTLNAEMDRISVSPKHKNILKAAFRNRAKVLDEDGVRNVVIANDEGIELSATDFFNNFKETEDGKTYILAAPTIGGGAPGGKGRRGNVDFNAERRKALQNKDSRSSVNVALAQYFNKK